MKASSPRVWLLTSACFLALTTGTFSWRLLEQVFREGINLSLGTVKGIDFRALYQSAQFLQQGIDVYASPVNWRNVYPPLATLLVFPLTIFSADTAYFIFAFGLLAALLGMLSLCFLEFAHLPSKAERWGSIFSYWAILSMTYPVLFAIERGNNDIWVGFLMSLFLTWLTKGKTGPALVALTLAVQLKVYPIILVAFLLLRAGPLSVVLFSLLNGVLFAVLGVPGFQHFWHSLGNFNGKPAISVISHSLISFIGMCNHHWHWHLPEAWLNRLLSLLMIAAFVVAGFLQALPSLSRRLLQTPKLSAQRKQTAYSRQEVGLLGMAFCLMSLIPPTGFDYRLPIHVVPYILWLGLPGISVATDRLGTWCEIVIAANFGLLFTPLLGPKTPFLLVAFAAYGWMAIAKRLPSTDDRGHDASTPG